MLLCFAFSCQGERSYAEFGGETNWEEADYASLIFTPDSFGDNTFYPVLVPIYRDALEGGYYLWFDDNLDFYYLKYRLSIILPELPRLRCYRLNPLPPDPDRPIHESVLTATLNTEEGGGGGEQYKLTSDATITNEVCFTGITEDRKLFQGYFTMAFTHDTLGPRIYPEDRPTTFTVPMANFQVTLRE